MRRAASALLLLLLAALVALGVVEDARWSAWASRHCAVVGRGGAAYLPGPVTYSCDVGVVRRF